LDKISEFDLLQKLFGTVTTTLEISEEFNKPLPGWVTLNLQPTIAILNCWKLK